MMKANKAKFEGMRLGKLKGRIKQAAARAHDVAACCAMPADGDRVAAAEALLWSSN